MDFLVMYNKDLDNFYNNILKKALISAFVLYYGDNFEGRIRNVIENLIIIRVNENKDGLYFKKIAKEMINILELRCYRLLKTDNFDVNNFYKKLLSLDVGDLNQLIIDSNGLLNVNDINEIKRYLYMFNYYNKLEELSSIDSKMIFVGKSDQNYDYEKLIINGELDSFLGVSFCKINDNYVVALNGYGINLHTLIHEINHLLSRELLGYNTEKEDFEVNVGFRNSGDFLYEIINDYMANEVYDNVDFNLISDYEFLLDRTNDSAYLELDNICGNYIKRIYKISKDLIRKSLIEGNGKKFVKIISNKVYANINFALTSVFSDIENFVKENPGVDKSKFTVREDDINRLKKGLDNVVKKLIEYDIYNENIDKQLIELEKKGTIKRI